MIPLIKIQCSPTSQQSRNERCVCKDIPIYSHFGRKLYGAVFVEYLESDNDCFLLFAEHFENVLDNVLKTESLHTVLLCINLHDLKKKLQIFSNQLS